MGRGAGMPMMNGRIADYEPRIWYLASAKVLAADFQGCSVFVQAQLAFDVFRMDASSYQMCKLSFCSSVWTQVHTQWAQAHTKREIRHLDDNTGPEGSEG